MNQIDVNYILDGQVELFDWLFLKKVGIDADKNYVYLVEDKFRDQRYAKFVLISQPARIKQNITQLLIYQNSNDSKLIQPIYDFTVSKEKKMILVTMPVPPRTLYSVIKDSKVDLRARLFLVQNLSNGGVYMHNRRRSIFGQIRPESIVVHEELNSFDRAKGLRRFYSSESVQLYARLNSFCTLIETQTKPQKWKWMSEQLQYYDAPEIWSQIDKKKKNQITLHTGGQSQKSMDMKPLVNKYTDKSDVWALGLVFIQILSAMRISQLLQDKTAIPGRMLKQITIKQKILKQRMKSNPGQSEKIQQQSGMTVENFYAKLCRNIQSLAIKTVIEKMLSIKPQKRPNLQEVLHIVERLEVIDKRNKNMGRMISYKRSLKSLKQSADVKNQISQNKDQDHNEDKKSVVSMKSVRSGKSSKSHYSQTRKRIPPDFSTLLYARQAISEIHVQTVNPLYRTYFEDCKNRLPSDINFAPPPKKILMKKEDKAIVLSLKGENDEDILKWNIQKVMTNRNPQPYDQRAQDGTSKTSNPSPYSQNRNLANDVDKGTKSSKKYEAWLHNLRIDGQQHKNSDEYSSNFKGDRMALGFGPVVKKIPHNSSTIKQLGYNDNLSNFHYLGVQNLKKQIITQTCLNRRQCNNSVEAPEKPVQFILNLRNIGLASIPQSLHQYLQPPNCLKYLCLAKNYISSLIGLDMALILRNTLIILDLNNNNLQRIDIGLWKFKNLEQIYLANNCIAEMKGFERQYKQNSDTEGESGCDKSSQKDMDEIIDQEIMEQANRIIQNCAQHKQNEAQNAQTHRQVDENAQQDEDQLIYLMQRSVNSQGESEIAFIQQSQVRQFEHSAIIRAVNQIEEKYQKKAANFGKQVRGKGVSRKLRKIYINNNKIKQLENILNLPELEVVAIGQNPLAENLNNLEAIQALRIKNVKIFY